MAKSRKKMPDVMYGSFTSGEDGVYYSTACPQCKKLIVLSMTGDRKRIRELGKYTMVDNRVYPLFVCPHSHDGPEQPCGYAGHPILK